MLRSLDAARTEREAAMKKQREFVADASHELRTPLTSVLANLELLQASLRAPSQDEDRADGRLRPALLAADEPAGRRPPAAGPCRCWPGRESTVRCDLAEIAGNVAVEAGALMGDRELEIDNEQPLPVEGNADELHRMVLNLLDNAARHTPSGARIELHVRRVGEEAVIEVGDDGPGIPAALREQIFDRFVRGEGPADTAVGPGSGLGLAIVRAVASSHGGTVEVGESAAGGALFRVRIPLQPSQLPARTF